MVVNIRDLTSVSNISQESSWEKILSNYDKLEDNDITLDTDGVYMMCPTYHDSFKNLLRRDNLKKVILRNENDLSAELKIYCIMEGLDLVIENIELEKAEVVKVDKNKITIGNEIRDTLTTIDGDKAYINVYGRYTNIGDTPAIDKVLHAVDRIITEDGIKDITLRFGDCEIVDFVIKYITKVVWEYEGRGIDLKADSNKENVINKFAMYMHNNLGGYTVDEREEYIRNTLRIGDCGLLIKYKKSRAVDEFGREGKGEIIQSRAAIYRGIVEENNTKYIIIDTFNKSKFYPSAHWDVMHDGETPTKLAFDRVRIKIEEFGLYEKFMGRKYHFSKAVQYDIKDREEIVISYNSNGGVDKKLCTIPELMLETFEDWEIEYNKDTLEEAIKETNEILGL